MIEDVKSNKKEFFTSVCLVVLIQVILNLQGFDVCDDGFVLTFYQQFFNAPSTVEYNFVYWFAGLIGGIWYEMSPNGGLIWFKVLTVLINTLSFIIAYKIFKPLIGSRLAILGTSVSLFVNDFGFLTFYHNQLTILLVLVSTYFILKGIKKQYLSIIMAGFFVALAIFTRLTNLTLLALILVFPVHNYISGIAVLKSIKEIFNFCLGILLGIIFVIALLFLFNQHLIMYNALESLIDIAGTKGSTHGLSKLVRAYVHDYKLVFKSILKFIFIFLFFIMTLRLKNKKAFRYVAILVNFILFFYWFKTGNVFTVYGLAYLGAFFILLNKQNGKELRLLSFMSILVLTFLTMGSDGAIYNCGYMCIWLSVPLFFYYFYNLNTISINIGTEKLNFLFTVKKEIFKKLVVVMLCSFFTAKAYNISQGSYFDAGSRIEKVHTLNSELSKGIYTKRNRAEITNDILENIKPFIKANDYLLVYDSAPMIHFLTETKPYLYNPWVWIYDSNTFRKKINLAQEEISVYPLIVVQKFITIGSFSEPITDYLSVDLENYENETEKDIIKKNIILKSFIQNNDYQVIWSNDYFNIYKTNKVHK